MAQDNWWGNDPVVSTPQAPRPATVPGVIVGDPKPIEPKDPKTTWRVLSPEEAEAAGLPAGRTYKQGSNGDVVPVGDKIGGKPFSDGAAQRVEKGVGTYSSLASSLGGFQDEYAGNTITGGLENTIQGAFGSFGTPGQRDWWAAFQQNDNVIRNELFGATLTPSEQKSYADTTVNPSLDPKIVRENLKRRATILRTALDRQRRFMIANGYDPEAVAILYEPVTQMEALAGSTPEDKKQDTPPAGAGANGGGTPPPLLPSQTPGVGGGQPMAPAQGGMRAVNDPNLANKLYAMLQDGRSLDEINEYAQSQGAAPIVFNQETLDYAKQNPGWNPFNANRYEPVSGFERAVTPTGGSGFIDQARDAAVAYGTSAGQFLSGNTLDNMQADPERARLSMDIASQQSPIASGVGSVSGGVLAALTGEAMLARAGMAPGALRAALADTAMGAANGAGAADGPNQSRAGGALVGGGSALAGNVAGNAIVRGVGKAVAPTGGNMNALYQAGVRPTIGQRVAEKGVVGRAVNNFEQALQSVPFVGATISGARQEARDQFQVGAFNEALGEIGEQLPKGMKPGTDPHAYAQRSFDRVYAEARSAMTMRADEQLAQDLNTLAPDIATLGDAAQNKLKAIMRNQVNNRLVNGEMSGDAYKKAVSDLGKHVARMRKSSMSDDQALADVLENVKFSLDAAARRHSDPDAVKLLDAADAGYAKFVRLETAAARRGGDAGTFSPKQFDSAVQKESGGVRSKAYLRGDALMQDYAQAGRSLDDTLPNSGTPERVMAGYAVGTPVAGAAVYAEPITATVLGSIATAYAPGVRKVMQSAIAPAGPKRKAIAAQLKKIERLSSATGAALASQGTIPSQ